MRSLLNPFRTKKSGSSSISPQGKGNGTESPNSNANGNTMFRTFFGRSASFGESPGESHSRLGDVHAQWIHSASSTLSSSIEEILGNSAALSGENMSGFMKLLIILENDDIEIHTQGSSGSRGGSSKEEIAVLKTKEAIVDDDEEVDRWENDTGEGCIQVLLDNMDHPRFVEICNENNLVVSLVHAMRLLKILEIKAAKVVSSVLDADGKVIAEHGFNPSFLKDSQQMMGRTLLSAQRVCRLLEVLCSDPHTMELLNNNKSLEKLLTYPMTCVPEKALHLQSLVAKVITVICRQPMSADQVWLLHESNSISLMVRNLKELVAEPIEEDMRSAPNADINRSNANFGNNERYEQGDRGRDVGGEKGVNGAATKPVLLSPDGSVATEAASPAGWSPINTAIVASDAAVTGAVAGVGPPPSLMKSDSVGGGSQPGQTRRVSFGRLGEGDRLNSAGPGDNYSSSADRESTEGAVIFPAEKGVAPTQGELSKARTECRLLKGTSAEEKGMWVCGMNVIIDVLSASIYVNPVLLNDFECAGGYKLLVHMLSGSSQMHFMNGLIGVTRLLCDPMRSPEESISDLTAGAVILEVLVALLQIDEGLEALQPPRTRGSSGEDGAMEGADEHSIGEVLNDGDTGTSSGKRRSSAAPGSGLLGGKNYPRGEVATPASLTADMIATPGSNIETPLAEGGLGSLSPSSFTHIVSGNDVNKLARMSYTIYTHHVAGRLPSDWQSAVQSVAYTLLTLYSNQPKNCVALESAYHYLTILILTLPALGLGNGAAIDQKGQPGSAYSEVISAVLTTLDYVCNCAAEATPLPLTALNAATGVCSKLMLHAPTPGQESPSLQGWVHPAASTPSDAGTLDSRSGLGVSPLYPIGYSPKSAVGAQHSGLMADSRLPATPGTGVSGTIFNPGAGINIEHLRGLLTALEQIVACYDGLCRVKGAYTAWLMQAGFLTHIHCSVFEYLQLSLPPLDFTTSPGDSPNVDNSNGDTNPESPESSSGSNFLSNHQCQVYMLLLDLLVALLKSSDKHGSMALELRSLGLTVILRNLVRHPAIGSALTRRLLMVSEVLAAGAGTRSEFGIVDGGGFLEESMQSALDVLRQVRPQYLSTSSISSSKVSYGSPHKVLLLLESVRTMLLQNHQASVVWCLFGGSRDLMDTLESFRVIFRVHNSFDQAQAEVLVRSRKAEMSTVLSSFRVALECIVCELIRDNKAVEFRRQSRKSKAFGVSRALRVSEIMYYRGGKYATYCAMLVLGMVCGFPSDLRRMLQSIEAKIQGDSDGDMDSETISTSESPETALLDTFQSPIIFPDMALVLLDLLPEWGPELGCRALRALQRCAGASPSGYSGLAEADVVNFLYSKYGAVLSLVVDQSAVSTSVVGGNDRRDMKNALLYFLETVLLRHLRARDLLLVMKFNIRDAALDPAAWAVLRGNMSGIDSSDTEGEHELDSDDEKDYIERCGLRLPPPISSYSKITETGKAITSMNPGYGRLTEWALQLLERIAREHATAGAFAYNTPHLSINSSASTSRQQDTGVCLDVTLPMSLGTRLLGQQSGCTFSSWFRFDRPGSGLQWARDYGTGNDGDKYRPIESHHGRVVALPLMSLSLCSGSTVGSRRNIHLVSTKGGEPPLESSASAATVTLLEAVLLPGSAGFETNSGSIPRDDQIVIYASTEANKSKFSSKGGPAAQSRLRRVSFTCPTRRSVSMDQWHHFSCVVQPRRRRFNSAAAGSTSNIGTMNLRLWLDGVEWRAENADDKTGFEVSFPSPSSMGEGHLSSTASGSSSSSGIASGNVPQRINTSQLRGKNIDASSKTPSLYLSMLSNADVGVSHVRLSVGRSNVGSSEFQPRIFLMPSWKLGPVALYETVLNAQQIAYMYVVGPSISGQQATSAAIRDSPLHDHVTSISTSLQHRFLSKTRGEKQDGDVAGSMASRGLAGLERVVEPSLERCACSTTTMSIPNLPTAVLEYNARSAITEECAASPSGNTVKEKDNDSLAEIAGATSLISMLNCASADRLPVALLTRYTVTPSDTTIVGAGADYLAQSLKYPCGHTVCAQSYASVVEALGGPCLFLPLVHAACTAPGLSSALNLLHASLLNSTINLKFMQSRGGYKALAFVMYQKPDLLLRNKEVIRALLDFAVIETEEGEMCITDTVAMHHLTLNHLLWRADNFMQAKTVVSHLCRLVNDRRYGQINALKLSALGTVRWALMLMWHGVHGERAKERPAQVDEGSGEEEEWYYVPYEDRSTSDGQSMDDPFLASLCKLVKEVMAVEVRRKDVDLLASLCLHTFSISQHLYVKIPTRGATSRDQELLSQPSPLVPASTGAPSSPSNSPKQYLTTSSITRFHVLRLLCALAVDLHTKPDYQLSLPRTATVARHDNRAFGRSSAGSVEEMEASSAASGSIGAAERVKLRNHTPALLRSSLDPDWFLCILERVSDSSTFTQALMLLVLFMQQDERFAVTFFKVRGWPALRAILCCRPQPLSVVLPLIALLLGIPVTMMPSARHLESGGWRGSTAVEKVASLLSLEQVVGPPMTPYALVCITHPTFAILMEVVTLHVGGALSPSSTDHLTDKDVLNFSPDAAPVSPVTELLLGLLTVISSPIEMSVSTSNKEIHSTPAPITALRALLQSKNSIAAIVSAWTFCSTISADEADSMGQTRILTSPSAPGARADGTLGTSAGASGNVDLSTLVHENYIAAGPSSPDNSANEDGVTAGSDEEVGSGDHPDIDKSRGARKASFVRYIDDDVDPSTSGMGMLDGRESRTVMESIGYEGHALAKILANIAFNALKAEGLPASVDVVSSAGIDELEGVATTVTEKDRMEACGESNLGIVVSILTAYPTHMPQQRHIDYQVAAFKLIDSVLRQLAGLSLNDSTSSMPPSVQELGQLERLADSLTLLVPLCEENLVASGVLDALLDFCCVVLRRMQAPSVPVSTMKLVSKTLFATEQKKEHEHLQRISLYRDYVLTARYFAGMIMRGVGSTDGLSPQKKRPSLSLASTPLLSPSSSVGTESASKSFEERGMHHSSTSGLRGMKTGTIKRVRAAMLLLIVEPSDALSPSSSSPHSSVPEVSKLGDSVRFIGAGVAEGDGAKRSTRSGKLPGADMGGSGGGGSRLGTFRERFTRRTTINTSNNANVPPSAPSPDATRTSADQLPASSSVSLMGTFSGGSSKAPGDISVIPHARHIGASLSRELELATADKWAASVCFLPTLLCWCQERLLDDDDVARKESALIMALIYSHKPGYSTDLLCRPLKLPLPLHFSQYGYSTTSGKGTLSGTAGVGLRGRGASYDEDTAASLVGAISGGEADHSDPGNYHAIISKNAHARKIRKATSIAGAITGHDSHNVMRATSPVELYAGYDMATLYSIYGVPDDQVFSSGTSSVLATEPELLPQGFYAQGLSILATAIENTDASAAASLDTEEATQLANLERDGHIASYSFWLTDGDNRLRVARLFEHIDYAVNLHKEAYAAGRGVFSLAGSSTQDVLSLDVSINFLTSAALNGANSGSGGNAATYHSPSQSAVILSTPDALTCGNGIGLGPSDSSSFGVHAAATSYLRSASPLAVGGVILSPADVPLNAFSSISNPGATGSGPAGVAANDFVSRAEEGQRRGEAVIGVYRRWCLNYYSLLSRGAMLWHKTWTQQQSGLIWGCSPPTCAPVSESVLQLLEYNDPALLEVCRRVHSSKDQHLSQSDTKATITAVIARLSGQEESADVLTERELRLARKGIATKGLSRPSIGQYQDIYIHYVLLRRLYRKYRQRSEKMGIQSAEAEHAEQDTWMTLRELPKIYRMSLTTEGFERSRRLMLQEYCVPLRLKIDLPRSKKEKNELLRIGRESSNLHRNSLTAMAGNDAFASRRATLSITQQRRRVSSKDSNGVSGSAAQDQSPNDIPALESPMTPVPNPNILHDMEIEAEANNDGTTDGNGDKIVGSDTADHGGDMQSFLKHASRAGYFRRKSVSDAATRPLSLDAETLLLDDALDDNDNDNENDHEMERESETRESLFAESNNNMPSDAHSVSPGAMDVTREGEDSEALPSLSFVDGDALPTHEMSLRRGSEHSMDGSQANATADMKLRTDSIKSETDLATAIVRTSAKLETEMSADANHLQDDFVRPTDTAAGGRSRADTDISSSSEMEGVQLPPSAESQSPLPPGTYLVDARDSVNTPSEAQDHEQGVKGAIETDRPGSTVSGVSSLASSGAEEAENGPEHRMSPHSADCSTPTKGSSTSDSGYNTKVDGKLQGKPDQLTPPSQVKRKLNKEKRRAERVRKQRQEWRNSILEEMARGLVGASEWATANMYNVNLICGMELMPALLVVTTSGSQPTESPAGHSPRRARATGSATTASNTSPNSSRPSSGSGNGNATGTSGAMSGSSSPDAAKLHILLGYRARSANASLANEGGVGTADLGDDKDTPLVGSECVVEWVGALNTAGARSISRQATTEDPTIRDTASFADNYSLSWRNGSYYTALAAYSQREEDKSLVVNTVNTSTNSTNSAVAGQGWKPLSGALLAGSEAEEEEISDYAWCLQVWQKLLCPGSPGYLTMSSREIYTIFKRRHQLKYSALELSDTRGTVLLFSCSSVSLAHHLLGKLLDLPLPSSMFRKALGNHRRGMRLLARGVESTYNRLVSKLIAAAGHMWESGQLSNFEYLMHLNAAAGRSYQDLTQYPVFPWVLNDYTSPTLDLHNPEVYRDLSKPMGALGSGRRVEQFRERYASIDELYQDEEASYANYDSDSDSASVASSQGPAGMGTSTPAFFYGTHYSCAGYVLHYLCRMQPFTDMAVALQGGRFDQPDRLFLDIGASWKSASQDNLQDVRELIPEFFYSPEFLVNRNKLDLGVTQRGEVVDDVRLPPWAKGSAYLFIRKHREALESKHVSENLHSWIDLIFGYKQRGQAAIDSMNVFIHLTYEGEVNIDAIDDPMVRAATISQINNFGQCPSQLFGRPHKARAVPPGGNRPRPPSLTSDTDTALGNGNASSDSTNIGSHKADSASSSAAGKLNLAADFEGESQAATALSMRKAENAMSVTALRSLATDYASLGWHEQLCPPFCVIGASHIVMIAQVGRTELFSSHLQHSNGLTSFVPFLSTDGMSSTTAVGDIQLHKNTIVACSQNSVLLSPMEFGRRAMRFRGCHASLALLSSPSGVSSSVNQMSQALGMHASGGGSGGGTSSLGGIMSSGGVLSEAFTSIMGVGGASSGNSSHSGSNAPVSGNSSGGKSNLVNSNIRGGDPAAGGAGINSGDVSVSALDVGSEENLFNQNVSHSVFLDAHRDIQSIHEQLHAAPISCMCIDHPEAAGSVGTEKSAIADGIRGRYAVTGSEDCSVKVWDLAALLSEKRARLHAVLVGHSAPITCVDFCGGYGGLVVSGASDGSVYLWEIKHGTLVRQLRCSYGDIQLSDRHADVELSPSVLAVSISASTGDVAVVTSASMVLYSIAGCIIAKHDFLSARLGQRPTMVRMIPSGEWQMSDGAICVTGHESGAVHLWRLRPLTSSLSSSEFSHSLNIAFTLPSEHHRSPITALRVSAVSASSYTDTVSGAVNLLGRSKGPISRDGSPAGAYELLVGDSEGLVSRWQAPRLESVLQLSEGRGPRRTNRDREAPSGAAGMSAGDILRFL